jgi:hypothetical protein
VSERSVGLIAWQWSDYAAKHRDPLNLWLHFFAVPAFIAGSLAAVLHLLALNWLGAGFALVFALLAFALQGLGHRREPEAPAPFNGPLDVLARIAVEQFITFPRFLLSGGWIRNLTRKTP